MSMFTNLAALMVAQQSITIIVTGAPERLSVAIMSTPTPGQPPISVAFEASAAELDAKLPGKLAELANLKREMDEAFSTAATVLAAAKKEQQSKATKALTTGAKKPAAAAVKTGPSALDKIASAQAKGDDDDAGDALFGDDESTETPAPSAASTPAAASTTQPTNDLADIFGG